MFGKIKGYLPYVGIFTIWLNDYPLLKWTLLGFMALFVIISKDPE
jgi:signal peptidase